jgi:hypothetical protein
MGKLPLFSSRLFYWNAGSEKSISQQQRAYDSGSGL